MFSQYEYLGNCDWIEPSLDPTPDSGKEGRCANNLPKSARRPIIIPGAYIYSVKRLRVVCCRQYTGILHMRFQIPELCQPYVRDIDNVGGVCDWDFGIWSFEGGAQRQDEIE